VINSNYIVNVLTNLFPTPLGAPFSGVVKYVGVENLLFSTEIAFYLGNGTIYSMFTVDQPSVCLSSACLVGAFYPHS